MAFLRLCGFRPESSDVNYTPLRLRIQAQNLQVTVLLVYEFLTCVSSNIIYFRDIEAQAQLI